MARRTDLRCRQHRTAHLVEQGKKTYREKIRKKNMQEKICKTGAVASACMSACARARVRRSRPRPTPTNSRFCRCSGNCFDGMWYSGVPPGQSYWYISPNSTTFRPPRARSPTFLHFLDGVVSDIAPRILFFHFCSKLG